MDNPNLKIENLKATFPDCVHTTTDQSGHVRHTIDFERLKKEIVASADCDVQERYSFTWPGKQDALRAATTPTKTTAQPCEAESIDFDHSHNLFLEGDNLECLKHLLATHTQKIKMIYIDPPYNTGSEFLYSDNFSISKEQYCGTKTKGNDTSGMNSAHTEGRHHAQWLSMMYSRLKVARTLMSEDGVIFISIDDHEIHNLRKMCDEIFGAANFISTFCWEKKKKPSFLDKNVASKFEYICTYAKDKSRTGAFSVDVTTKDKKYPLNNAGNTRAQLTFLQARYGLESLTAQ